MIYLFTIYETDDVPFRYSGHYFYNDNNAVINFESGHTYLSGETYHSYEIVVKSEDDIEFVAGHYEYPGISQEIYLKDDFSTIDDQIFMQILDREIFNKVLSNL